MSDEDQAAEAETTEETQAEVSKEKREQLDIFEVKMIPNGFSSEEDVKCTWKVTLFTEKKMEIQLMFAQPLLISNSNE